MLSTAGSAALDQQTLPSIIGMQCSRSLDIWISSPAACEMGSALLSGRRFRQRLSRENYKSLC